MTAGVLCGQFLGAGSKVIVATIAHGACWGIVGWTVLAFRSGSWQLISRGDGQLFLDPITAAGSGFRETQHLFRKTDTGCNPTNGTRARVWHWDAKRKRLMASNWKYAFPVDPNPQEFRVPLPLGNVFCAAAADDQLVCEGSPPQKAGTSQLWQVAILRPNGQVVTCTQRGDSHCFQGNSGEFIPDLTPGQQTTIGPYLCKVEEAGVECTFTATGKGFLITPTDITVVGG